VIRKDEGASAITTQDLHLHGAARRAQLDALSRRAQEGSMRAFGESGWFLSPGLCSSLRFPCRMQASNAVRSLKSLM
jgi:hypothetical protein